MLFNRKNKTTDSFQYSDKQLTNLYPRKSSSNLLVQPTQTRFGIGVIQ
jgi:hypothetical protein